jgi:hypothetical protein
MPARVAGDGDLHLLGHIGFDTSLKGPPNASISRHYITPYRAPRPVPGLRQVC